MVTNVAERDSIGTCQGSLKHHLPLGTETVRRSSCQHYYTSMLVVVVAAADVRAPAEAVQYYCWHLKGYF